MTALTWTTNTDWYLMRASGFVVLALMTISVALGVANLGRLALGAWTRTVAALVHRNVALLGTVFLGVHIVTAITDKYVDIPAVAIIVPGPSRYDPLWIGLGAAAVDLVVAIVVTSLIRSRLDQRAWQYIHWLAYLMWPLALAHSVGSGTGSGRDTGAGWSTLIYVSCGVCFVMAGGVRIWLNGRPAPAPVRSQPRLLR